MSRPSKQSHVRNRRGAVAVEFAVVSGLLFLFTLASIEFGRMNIIRHTVDNAAFEAARRVSVPNASSADAVTRALQVMQSVRARGVQVIVDPARIDDDTERVTVTVNVSADDNGWIAPRFFSGRTMTGTCTMQREQF